MDYMIPKMFKVVAHYEAEIVLMHNGDGHRDDPVAHVAHGSS